MLSDRIQSIGVTRSGVVACGSEILDLSGMAAALDAADELKKYRDQFRLPLFGSVGAVLVPDEKCAPRVVPACGND